MNAPATVSVVVSTRNRAQLLPRLFEALAAQVHPPFEVVVVDDGSDDDTTAVLRELASVAPFTTTVLRGTGQGPAAGRNLGYRHALAPVVAFTDDDCVPSAGWLAAGVRALGDRRAIVVGKTLPNPDQAANLGPFSRTLTVTDSRFFQTCNIFYRRADLDAVGGFDPEFDKPGGEDTDLALRIIDGLGVEARFAEDALVYHDVRPSDFRASLREARRWTGVPRLFAKHPYLRAQHLHYRLFWKPSHPPVMLAWLGLLGALADRRSLGMVLPWLWYRGRTRRVGRGRRQQLIALPGVFLLDTTEVVTMVRASVRERTLVL